MSARTTDPTATISLRKLPRLRQHMLTKTLIEADDPAVTEGGGPYWLVTRRSISDGEYAFYRAHAPRPHFAVLEPTDSHASKLADNCCYFIYCD